MSDYDTPSGLRIVIKEFYERLRPDGKTDTYVAYSQPGQLGSAVTSVLMRHIMKATEPPDNSDSNARANWDLKQVIEKAHKVYKSGEELPIEGTPLSAWNAIHRDVLETFKRSGIRTVEEVAMINDTLLTKIPIPNIRALKAQASIFLKAQDANKASTELQKRDDVIRVLQEQMAEIQKALPEKRGPGRPAKVHEAAA